MAKTNYLFLRSTELSGRHPYDVGEWVTYPNRVKFGEGTPADYFINFDGSHIDNPDSFVEHPTSGLYPPAPKLPRESLQKFRICAYKRIRHPYEADLYLNSQFNYEIKACIYVFPNWANPKDGIILHPDKEQKPLHDPHCVPLIWADDNAFCFMNSWGAEWGNNGKGYFDSAYFSRYCFESWACYHEKPYEFYRTHKSNDVLMHRWVFREELNRKLHGLHITDTKHDDRYAWLFALERGNYLEIEELFVLPEHRNKGYATKLINSFKELAKAKGMQTRLWVPFSETNQEAPSTYSALLKVAARLGVRFQKCPVQWAAYYGTTSEDGSQTPIEPDVIPVRPKSMRATVLAALMLTLFPSLETPTLDAVKVVLEQNNITERELDEFNDIRYELIKKENREGLSPSEKIQLDTLQEASRKLFPVESNNSLLLQEIDDLMKEYRGQAQ